MHLADITCKLGVSKVQGIGVIALKNIKEGDKMWLGALDNEWYGPTDCEGLNPDIKQYLIEHWAPIETGSDFVYPFDILTCYLNHSDKPNYDPLTDTALRNIKKGEEVFEDYGKYKDLLLAQKNK